LRRLLKTVTDQGFTVGALNARSLDSTAAEGAEKPGRRGMVEVVLTVQGRYPVSELAATLSEIEEVDAVLVGESGVTT
jgi:acetolactate synthase regulatory subunit